MYVTVHGPNQTSVTTKYIKVFFSYDTPVAIVRLDVIGSPLHGFESTQPIGTSHRTVMVTEKKYSNTTSKHTNAFCSLYEGDSSKWRHVTQEYIDDVVSCI